MAGAENGVAALGAQNIALQEKHEAEAKPAHIQSVAANAQNNPNVVGNMLHHEAPIKYYGVDPRDKEVEQKLILNQLATRGVLPQMIGDNRDIAQWVSDKTKVAEADQFVNEILTFYDLTSLAEKREFDRKFPWLKEMKLKRIREVAAMHLRIAELCENSDPSIDDVKYIIDLLHGKAKLPPTLLPAEIHANLEPRGEAAGGPQFYEGMFNPFKFTNPIDTGRKNAVVAALGTNVLGRGFLDRWNRGATHQGPQNLREWTQYFVDQAVAGQANIPFGGFAPGGTNNYGFGGSGF